MAIEQVTMAVARKIAGVRQEDAAKACGVSVATISNWEKGITEPTVTQAKTFANLVGLHIDDIIFLS